MNAFLTAANSEKEVVGYEPWTVEMFFYNELGKVQWDRLSYALSTADEITSNGMAVPTPSPDPNDCMHSVPCGYIFHASITSPGNALYISGMSAKNFPCFQLKIDSKLCL